MKRAPRPRGECTASPRAAFREAPDDSGGRDGRHSRRANVPVAPWIKERLPPSASTSCGGEPNGVGRDRSASGSVTRGTAAAISALGGTLPCRFQIARSRDHRRGHMLLARPGRPADPSNRAYSARPKVSAVRHCGARPCRFQSGIGREYCRPTGTLNSSDLSELATIIFLGANQSEIHSRTGPQRRSFGESAR